MPNPLRQIRWQIAVAYTLLIVLILAGLAVVEYFLTRGTYMRTLEQGVAGQAYLVAALTETLDPNLGHDRLDALVDDMGERLAARVTLIGPDGFIVADSVLPPQDYASRLDRPEVVAALQSGRGETRRYSASTRDDRFYVAVPFRRDSAVAGVARVGVPITTISTAQAQIAGSVLITAMLAGVISFALAILVAGRTTRPLLQLRKMAERVAAGDLNVRVPLPPGEEVGALAQSFNQMASQLRQLVEAQASERERLATILATMHDGILILDDASAIRLANRAAVQLLGLTRAIPIPLAELAAGPALLRAVEVARQGAPEQGERLIDELSPQPDGRSLRAIITPLGGGPQPQTLVLIQDLTELRRVERSRRFQLTNITHDLRTPLASLQALLDTLLDGAIDDPETARDFLSRMDIEVQGLSQLVAEFLALSRIELGQISARRDPTDLPALLRGVAERMEAQARQKGVVVNLAAMPALPPVNVNRGQIQQVLLNLLQNALAHTPAGGQITLGARQEADGVVIAVRDTGAGIAPDDLPHIFDRFYKADQSRHDGGVGLGLAIAQHLVEHHGGRIWAESAPGKGARFSFTLPVERHDEGVEAPR